MLTNKTAIECWNILKYEIENKSKRSYEQKLACNIKITARVFMHMSGVNKTYKTRLDL